MNITHSNLGKFLKYSLMSKGQVFRFIAAQDALMRTSSGHVYLSDGTHINDNGNYDGNYDYNNVILLDHELIIKGEL